MLMMDLINSAKENLCLEPCDKRDVFLILCSINFLNAMIKKKEYKDVIHYGVIKPRVSRLFERCIEDNALVDDFFLNQKERCAYIRSYGLQFSFHNIQESDSIKEFAESSQNHVLLWDGIRLQPIAEKLFQIAIELHMGAKSEKDVELFVESIKVQK